MLVRKGGIGSDKQEPGCEQRPQAGASGARLRHLGAGRSVPRGRGPGEAGCERQPEHWVHGVRPKGQEWQLAGAAQGEGLPRRGPARNSSRCSHPGNVAVTEGLPRGQGLRPLPADRLLSWGSPLGAFPVLRGDVQRPTANYY